MKIQTIHHDRDLLRVLPERLQQAFPGAKVVVSAPTTAKGTDVDLAFDAHATLSCQDNVHSQVITGFNGSTTTGLLTVKVSAASLLTVNLYPKWSVRFTPSVVVSPGV